MNIRNILIKHWGHDGFRPLQEDIIRSVLSGNDTLALLPTGGGKSVCFQVPALAMEGVCVVVTPLVALMKDQVRNLQNKGIKAAAIYAGMPVREMEMHYDNSTFGDLKFLYVSPERLQTERFRNAFERMKACLLAVDEAHCISQWGYDFRPPYLKIAEIRKLKPSLPVLALTATATPEVVKDIQQRLGFVRENVFQKSFERKNLTYLVIREEDKTGRLLRILEKVPGPAIIYARNRRKTEEISRFLAKNKIKADFYHAGLDLKIRDKKQAGWMHNLSRVIVATNAFGMGIDKPDVRLVLHFDLPDSMEAYFQEAGRAGRDEKRSYAVVLYNDADLVNLKKVMANEYPGPEIIRNVYQSLGNYLQVPVGAGRDVSFDLDLARLSERAGFSQVIVYNSLKFLEREGYLQLGEALNSPSRIYISCSREDLYRYQVENPKYDPFIKALLRSYSGLFSGFVPISESELSKRMNTGTGEVISALEVLSRAEILEYDKQKDMPQVILTRERIDQKQVMLSPENYRERKKAAELRLQAISDYVVSEMSCRSQLLLRYFGEESSARCGRCDVCRQRNKLDLNEMEFQQIHEMIIEILGKGSMTLPELMYQLKDFPEDTVLKVIRWLQDKGTIGRDEQLRYHVRKQFRFRFNNSD